MARAVGLMFDSLGIGASVDFDRFGDMDQTLAAYFGLSSLNNGASFLKPITLESWS